MHYCPIRKITVNRNDHSRHVSAKIRTIKPSITLAITARATAMARGES